MSRFAPILFLAAAACTHSGIRQVETREVAVTRVDRALSEPQVRANLPPLPLGPRPVSLTAAADALAAKLCEYVLWSARSDAMNQHAAGMPLETRVREPICGR